MSRITDSTPSQRPQRIALHAAGLLLAALANPLIYFDRSPVAAWLGTVAGAVAMAAIFYGLFWLLFPRRARAAGVQRLVLVLWFSMGMMILGGFSMPQSQQATSPKPAIAEPEPDWERGVITPPPSR